ncbi:MAG: cytochrome c3 family protein [Polyangiales bacterium]
MRSRAALLTTLALGVVAGAVVAQPRPAPRAWVTDRAPSHVIFPTQSIPLRFDHARHLRLAGVTCERCHATAASSQRASDRLIPPESSCAPCHAIDRARPEGTSSAGAPATRCDACHVGWSAESPLRVARVQIPPPNLRFSHARHVGLGARCVDCHASATTSALATRLELPRMEGCLSCHRAGGAPDRCATCHLTQPDGVLQTRFAEGWMNPPTSLPDLHHDADFWVNHRFVAARDASRCATCHRDDDCAACHDGRVRDRRTHPNDYVTQHVSDARMNADRCGSCHRAATFCAACHQRIGVSMTRARGARHGRFHPASRCGCSPP